MKNVEKKVKEQDDYIKMRARDLKEATDNTVQIEGFEQKIETKLIKFMNKEHKKRFSNTGLSRLDDTQAIFEDMQYGGRNISEVKAKGKGKPLPEQNILDTMDLGISRIEHFNEQDTLFGDNLNLSKMPKSPSLITGFG